MGKETSRAARFTMGSLLALDAPLGTVFSEGTLTEEALEGGREGREESVLAAQEFVREVRNFERLHMRHLDYNRRWVSLAARQCVPLPPNPCCPSPAPLPISYLPPRLS